MSVAKIIAKMEEEEKAWKTAKTLPEQQEEVFRPCHMFFYGSLMDPEVLSSILSLHSLPKMQKGSITGFKMKMWGSYPTIIRTTDEGNIQGLVWKLERLDQFKKLQRYESDAYTWCECIVDLGDGTVIEGCRTFCWAGNGESEDLEDGKFDLERYQAYLKKSVLKN